MFTHLHTAVTERLVNRHFFFFFFCPECFDNIGVILVDLFVSVYLVVVTHRLNPGETDFCDSGNLANKQRLIGVCEGRF